MITLRDLLAGRSTIDQLDILGRADRRWSENPTGPVAGWRGRYYGGSLTGEDAAYLDPPKQVRGTL